MSLYDDPPWWERMEEDNHLLTQENEDLKQRIRELEGSLLHCARCGRGIGEEE